MKDQQSMLVDHINQQVKWIEKVFSSRSSTLVDHIKDQQLILINKLR
jgi:hypothetical protein